MPEIAELEIPEIVKDYLEPIRGDSPVGIDASSKNEYFVLNMEIPKADPDYKKCIELSAIILKEQSKDIKIGTWLCFAMFRTEKIKGLVNGLKIIYYLLKKFENNLYPTNPKYRSNAIQFLNQPRFFKLVEEETPNLSDAKDFIEANAVINGIVNECTRLFPENVPKLNSIIEVMQEHVESANNLLLPPKEKKEIPPKQPPLENKKEMVEKHATETKEVEKSTVQVSLQEESVIQPVKVSSEKDEIVKLKKILNEFYEYQIDGVTKEKVPESYFIFGISRQLQWGELFRPPETNSVTELDPPNQARKEYIRNCFEASDWNALIQTIEIEFLEGDSIFPYWLDTQRFVTKALEKKGGNYKLAAEEIKRQLAQLLNRIPDLYKLKFKDKLTPFADEETVKWICDEVMSSANNEDLKEQIILPPIIGEDYEPLNYEYKRACSELPINIEENITSMQKALEAEDRRKGKFLRRLNLANYCKQAKLDELAKVHLTELNSLIDEYNLTLWEPALCTSVWQSMYLVNNSLIKSTRDKELKKNFEKEQKELFTKIAKYDSTMAIKLKQKK